MKKTLRKKFVFFAMSAVTILLVVLIGAINLCSWILLDRQSEHLLHTIADGDGKFLQPDIRDRGPFSPSMDIDTLKSARFFMVRMDKNGTVRDINLDQISSVTEEKAVQYAERITKNCGRIERYRYETRQLGSDRLIFFMDISGQIQTFLMVLTLSSAIALLCWLIMLCLVILLSAKAVRPVLAALEKQKRFITDAGHELKTPLAIIQSNNDASALLLGETKYTQNIRRQTKRLNGLMSGLLTLAKLDEEVCLPRTAVNISELTEQMLLPYEEAVLKKGISLSRSIQPNVILQTHAETFSQMISALLDNALKYTPENGTIRIAVSTSGKQVEIMEENTCNLPNDVNPERLFERFYRQNSARTQEGDESGYGIGLSAARTVAQTFGGTLKAVRTSEGFLRFIARFP